MELTDQQIVDIYEKAFSAGLKSGSEATVAVNDLISDLRSPVENRSELQQENDSLQMTVDESMEIIGEMRAEIAALKLFVAANNYDPKCRVDNDIVDPWKDVRSHKTPRVELVELPESEFCPVRYGAKIHWENENDFAFDYEKVRFDKRIL